MLRYWEIYRVGEKYESSSKIQRRKGRLEIRDIERPDPKETKLR